MGAAVVRRLAHAVVAVTCTSAKQNAEVVVVGTLGRHGCVDDMAGMVARLTRPEAAFVTGAGLSVDGGINT
jgi:NAD(P)-dependent dehydrogenase (short-subunit alcohol dehydrogenase family)